MSGRGSLTARRKAIYTANDLRPALLALVVSAILGSWSAAATADDVVITAEAKKRFAAGVALLEDPDGPRYEDAYRAFKSAYAASPSPKILGNIGLCAMKLERDGEAIDAYRRYLSEVDDIPPEEREQIQRDLGILEASSGEVTITADRADFEVADERTPTKGPEVRNVYGPFEGTTTTLRLRAGAHRLQVGDGEPVSVMVEAGTKREVRIESVVDGGDDVVVPEEPALPVPYVSRPMTLPAATLAPAIRVRAGQTVEFDTRFLLIGIDLVNARYGILDDLEIEAEVAPIEAEPRVNYGNATARVTYRFLDEVVELGSAVRLGHILFPGSARRFLLEPQVLRMLAHAGDHVRVDSGFAMPLYFGGGPVVAGMSIPVDVAIQLADPFFVGLGTGVGVFDFRVPGESLFIPASAFVGATVPLDNSPLLDVIGRFDMPQLFLPGRPDDVMEERLFIGSLTLRLFFAL